ncbi:MAG: hypothetical protein IPL26_04450 [Leptospiraceae bacterium]|nr:hypothetical protein [Leptospiraceae bacterium]
MQKEYQRKMKIINKMIYLFLFLIANNCNPPELKLNTIELCENFSSEGICKENLDKEHTYTIDVKRAKKFETWDSFANYIYFHSRQTPGFIIRFNRKFTMTEKDLIKKTYKAKYEFYGSSGHVEGMEIGEDWIGSFQYLGSIVKERQKQFKEEKNFPYMETIFPATIMFEFDSALAKGAISTKVDVKLKYEE